MESRACEQRQRPFPSEGDDAEEEIDDLQNGDAAGDGAVEVLGEEVPEDLGPEETF